MAEFDPSSHSHRRFNPLTRTWVLCSPHRTKRPWQGQTEPPQVEQRPGYDEKCYLCPGNTRAGGAKTDPYTSTYIFENDFAALVEDETLPIESTPFSTEAEDLFKVEAARGKCHVICFSPRHDLTVAEMSDQEILGVITAWTKLYKDVSKEHEWIKYIQIFENKGAMMGCSNPHPHGQSWSLSYIPTIPSTILASQAEFATCSKPASSTAPFLTDGRPSLLLSYAHAELDLHARSPSTSRIIVQSGHFIAVVPYWASWPFEVLVIPYKRHIPSLAYLEDEEALDLAQVLGQVPRRMDNLFECSFAYSMGVYQSPVHRPTDKTNQDATTQLHIGFLPPLLRSSSVRKFLVGFELFAETQRDITPEQAAEKLRAVDGEVHYKKKRVVSK